MTTVPICKVLALACVLALAPLPAFAASKPSCLFTVASARGEAHVKNGDMTVLAFEDEKLTLSWESKNARDAEDRSGHEVDLEGTEEITITRDTSYSYEFSNGSRKTECSVSFRLAKGSFDAETLVTSVSKPTFTGTASGTKTVRLLITDERGKKIFSSREAKVRKGDWEIRSTKTLKEGTYVATLLGAKTMELNVMATGTLTVLPKGSTSSKGGALSVSQLAILLSGGSALPGSSVPVAYIQVRNTGTATTSIAGFRLAENGSAPDDVVIGFSTSDDKGGSRTTIGGTEGAQQFKKGVAFVPLAATIGPSQLRIFTIKALISANSRSFAGTELHIDVAGTETGAKVSGLFPMRGVTWTLR
jgi:hypothetical protein